MASNEQFEQWVGLAAAVALPLIGGQLAALPTPPQILPGGWYTKIKKPRWTPPNWLFGPAWAVLYAAQGVASWFVWNKRSVKDVRLPLALYGIQLALNLIWQPIFFQLHRPDVATVDSAAVVAVGAAATATMSQVAGPEYILPLMLPYLAWTGFATVLSGVIAHRNPNADKIKGGDVKAETQAKVSKEADKAKGKVQETADKVADSAKAASAKAQ